MKTPVFAAALLMTLSLARTSLLPSSAGISGHPEVTRFLSLPKFDRRQLREITQGFYNLLELHASHVNPNKPVGRVLLEDDQHLFTTKIMNAVDSEIVGLKGDIKHSSKLTTEVGEVLGTAKGYFDKVKEAKDKLEHPMDAIGGAVKDTVSNALGGLGSRFGFRALEEEKKEEGESRSAGHFGSVLA